MARLGRFDYGRTVAGGYDETRAASASVLEPLRECLSAAPGRRLADIGGGTGNYAAALRDDGFEPVVIDVSVEMLRRAEAKGLATCAADAEALPFADGSFDAITMISMLHHVPDWRAALKEARRILRPGGRLAHKGFLRDHAPVWWPLRYFPSAREWFDATHPSLDETLEELRGARSIPIRFADLDDASMAALARHPELVLQAGRERRTAFFIRLERDAPDELEHGLERLERDLAAGAQPHLDADVVATRDRLGDAVVVCWAKPG